MVRSAIAAAGPGQKFRLASDLAAHAQPGTVYKGQVSATPYRRSARSCVARAVHRAWHNCGQTSATNLSTGINPQTGRVHGNFLLAMAKSGRFSSSKPNLQNIPKSREIRSVFVAAPGKCLVVADYSQLELRVMAEIASDKFMTEAYHNGLDLHAVTAAGHALHCPEELDAGHPAHKEARQKAKGREFWRDIRFRSKRAERVRAGRL